MENQSIPGQDKMPFVQALENWYYNNFLKNQKPELTGSGTINTESKNMMRDIDFGNN